MRHECAQAALPAGLEQLRAGSRATRVTRARTDPPPPRYKSRCAHQMLQSKGKKRRAKADPKQATLSFAGGGLGVRTDLVPGETSQKRMTPYVKRWRGTVPQPPPPEIDERDATEPPPEIDETDATIATPRTAPPPVAESMPTQASSLEVTESTPFPPSERGAASNSGVAGEDHLCCACMEVPSTDAFIPCGHKCCCGACAELVFKSLDAAPTCPLCRAPVQSHHRIYG